MSYRTRFQANALLCAGLGLMALRSVLQYVLDRTGHTNDATDFVLGAVFGVGFGLTAHFVWRNGRGARGPRTGASTT